MKYALLLIVLLMTASQVGGTDRIYVKEDNSRSKRSLPDRDAIFQQINGVESTNASADNTLVQTVEFFVQNTDTEDPAEVIVYNTIPGDAILTGFCIENQGDIVDLTGDTSRDAQARQIYSDAFSTGRSSVLLKDAEVLGCPNCRDSTSLAKQEMEARINVAPSDSLSFSISFTDGSPENNTDGLKPHYETNVTIELSNPARSIRGAIMSPNYPDPYPNNADLSWLIRVWSNELVINATVLSFETEPGCDYLFIYDGSSTTDDVLAAASGVEAQGQSVASTGQSMLIKFSSDCGVNNGGFAIEFLSQNITYGPTDNGSNVLDPVKDPTDETHAIFASSGFISSPGYPVQSPPFSTITWAVTSATNTFITLNIVDFDVDAPGSLTVYDTDDTLTLWSFSTSEIFIRGQAVFSSGNEISLELVTGENAVQTHRGIYTTFDSSSCYSALEIEDGDESWHTLASANYPSSYYDNTRCLWRITAPSGYFVRIEILRLYLENKYDVIRVYNASKELEAKLSGSSGKDMTSVVRSSTAFVHFYSDSSVTNSGFELRFSSYAHSPVCSSTTQTLYAPSGYVTNPDYPSETHMSTNCRWLIVVNEGMYVKILLESFDSEKNYHDILFYDGSSASDEILYTTDSDIAYTTTVTLMSSSNQVLVNITGSGYWEDLKYLFRYAQVDEEQARYCTSQYNLTVESATIRSPLYPSYYPSDTTCQWLIEAPTDQTVQIYFTEYDLGLEDSIKFYSGDSVHEDTLAVCDGVSRCYVDTYIVGFESSMVVVFESSSSDAGFFKLKIFSNTSECSTYIETTSQDSGYAISPNYPEYYPASYKATYCISVSEGKVIFFYFDSCYMQPTQDTLELYDGGSTSSTSLGVISASCDGYSGVTTGNDLTMIFQTGDQFSTSYDRGFKMRYSANADTLPSEMNQAYANDYIIIDTPGEETYLASPGTPNLYPTDTDFFWYFDSTFEAYRYSFIFYRIDLDPTDYIKIFEGLGISGDVVYTIYGSLAYYQYISHWVTAPQATVLFHSDPWYTGNGFYFLYSAIA